MKSSQQYTSSFLWLYTSIILGILLTTSPQGLAAVGDIIHVSVDSAGTQAAAGGDPNFPSTPSISADGRYIAFDSDAPNLVAGDTNGNIDVFVHDSVTGDTTRVSVDSTGGQTTGDDNLEISGDSNSPSISADGRYIAFSSDAPNLVTGDTNGVSDIFVHDTVTGNTTRVSVDSAGVQATGDDRFDPSGDSYRPSISADGRYIAFASEATNLVAGDTNGVDDIFVHDRVTGNTTRVSVDSAGEQATGDDILDPSGYSFNPSISADGRYIAFASAANNLVTGDTNGVDDVFVHDTVTGNTSRVSVDSAGAQATKDDRFEKLGDSGSPSISSDGRYIAFASEATNIVAGDTNDFIDVFVHDRVTGNTTRVSVDSASMEATEGDSAGQSISADGRYIAFRSDATNLVTEDTNGVDDIFVHDTVTGNTTRVSVDSASTEATSVSFHPSISADGRYIAFSSEATNLVARDTNDTYDVFRKNIATTTISDNNQLFKPGLYWNPQRQGWGINITQVSQDNGLKQLVAVIYTYRADGSPIWYLASAPVTRGSSWNATLQEYSWDGSSAVSTDVGTIELTFSAFDKALMSYTIQGESGSEQIQFFEFSQEQTDVELTALWFPPSEPGRGLTVSTIGNTNVVVLYFYDTDGQPLWLLGTQEQANVLGEEVNILVDSYTGYCLACTTTNTSATQAGMVSLLFNTRSSAKMVTENIMGWQANVPIVPLSDVINTDKNSDDPVVQSVQKP